MNTIETARLILRPFFSGDWQALHKMIVQYQASALAAYDHQWPTDPAEIRKVVEWFARGDAYLAVCLKDAGPFIGFVSLNPEQGLQGYDLGYILDAEYHGKGYATEACRAALAHAFDDLQAQRVVAGTAAANHASCRLLERLGFEKTGESTVSFRTGPDGKPIRFLGYSYRITRERWAAPAGR
jgi:RimJ/RimL family protein N-acetyltransferase